MAKKEQKPEREYRGALKNQMDGKGYISAPVAAEKCHVSKSTMYRWMEEGLVESIEVGHAKFVKLKSLKDHLGKEASEVLGL